MTDDTEAQIRLRCLELAIAENFGSFELAIGAAAVMSDFVLHDTLPAMPAAQAQVVSGADA